MAHKHSIYDCDTHFAIDLKTREIKNDIGKTVIVQNDHNSERFSFELPKEIEGHDMSLCNVVQVHFLNVDAKTKEQHPGLYLVDDLQISPDGDDVVILSWLLSQEATRAVGSLYFGIVFKCIEEDGTLTYSWHTTVNKDFKVVESLDNSNVIIDENPDILAQFEARLAAVEKNGGGESGSVKIKLVEALPETGEEGTIYLVPNDNTEANIYDEYLFINGVAELIGSDNYYTKDEIIRVFYCENNLGSTSYDATFNKNEVLPQEVSAAYGDFIICQGVLYRIVGERPSVWNAKKICDISPIASSGGSATLDIEVKTDTADEYILTLTTSDKTITTSNLKGKTGEKGKSAYQSAVDGGYEGTEEEFNLLIANAWFDVGVFKDTEDAFMFYIKTFGEQIITPNLLVKSAYKSAVDGGFEGTEEEFYYLLGNIGSSAAIERPTRTVELISDGVNGVFAEIDGTNPGYFMIRDAWGMLTDNPEEANEGVQYAKIGAEIKTIEFQIGESADWIDIHDMHTVDGVLCSIAMSKIYRNLTKNIEFAIVSTLWSGSNIIYNAIQNSKVLKIRVTYYDD